MTCKLNYEMSKGIKQVILKNCAQAPFKQFSTLGNSHQDSTTGAQLFDAKTIVRDMMIELDGNLVNTKGYFTSDFIKVEPSATYYINATGSKRGKYFDENKKVIFTNSFSDFNPEKGTVITTHEKASYIRFSGYIGSIETVMLNKGSSAIPYEPYTGGKPSPSPDYPQEIKNVGKWNEETQKYEVDIKVTGKNLFDIDSFLKLPLQPVSGNDSVRKLILTLKPNTKYTLSTNNEGTCNSQDKDTSRSLYFTNADDEIYQCNTTAVFKGKKVTVTSDENGRVKIVLFDRTNSKPIENKQCYVMLNEGTFAEPYEPYFPEQTATITMDEPLRGIGKYQDKITKDGIARRIRSVMLNGNEDWKLHGSNGNINNFGYILREAISNNVGQRSSLTFSSYKSGVWATDRLGQDMFARIIRINLPKDVFPDVETLRNWLSQSKTTLQYVLEKEVIVPISQSEQDAIRALTTYHPTTVIMVDGGEVDAGIEVEYAVKNKEKI